MIIVILILQLTIVLGKSGFYQNQRYQDSDESLKAVIAEIIEEITNRTDCIVFVSDSVYRPLIDVKRSTGSSLLLKYQIGLRDNEGFSRPRKNVGQTLINSKRAGCSAYIILISNGLLASKFLQYAESERLVDTRGLFLLLHDRRLFKSQFDYLWNRIINVVFIRRYNTFSRRSGRRATDERIYLDTVRYPQRRKQFTITKWMDSWVRGKFRYKNNHFVEKIANLKNNTLRIAIFEHIPAITDKTRAYYKKRPADNAGPLGIEFEIVEIVAKAMNFSNKYYMPNNIATERWGSIEENHTYTGLLREAVKRKASFYLGDLHYTMHHLNYFDLTVPYNTECLTFLTPESLNENSWKLLILPFRLYTWIALLLTLIVGGAVFHYLSITYKEYLWHYQSKKHETNWEKKEGMRGLYLFTELQNCILYAYSMLLQVSIPDLPNSWAVRVLIGWWWIYSILVAVAYRASMTATLANPVARVTIDTLSELTKSTIGVGGWSKESKEFFLTSSEASSQQIGRKFELVKEEDEAIERVANGSFCYYETAYLLKHARVKRQILEQKLQENAEEKNIATKYNLHIMQECVVNMPVALGMEKNSPLKPHVDKWIRRVIEVGLVEKWLSDVMEWSKIVEIRQETETEKVLVNLHKLQGAFIAVAIGYILGFLALLGEILYWKYIVLRNPEYDKYHLDIFYNNISK